MPLGGSWVFRCFRATFVNPIQSRAAHGVAAVGAFAPPAQGCLASGIHTRPGRQCRSRSIQGRLTVSPRREPFARFPSAFPFPPPDGQDDGTVTFKASRIDAPDSELVVFHSGHSTQSHPRTIQEMRRILLEALER